MRGERRQHPAGLVNNLAMFSGGDPHQLQQAGLRLFGRLCSLPETTYDSQD